MRKNILIRKSLTAKPNLENYEKTYKTFKWADAEKEISWFNGKLNAAYNAIDRHAETWRKNKVALYWEGENESKKFTFAEMKELSDKFANVLKKFGAKKGDRVFIFLPRIPELYISFIGILKTGAIAGTMFSAFGSEAIKDRLGDSGAKIVITDSELKPRLDKVMKGLPELRHVIVVGDKISGNGISYEKEMANASSRFAVQKMDREEPAFMLYTSGTTGKPKGVVHAHRAIISEHITAKWILDVKEDDTYWCTADPGWVTGIAYGILGIWSNGISTLEYSGRFDAEKWYSLIEKYKITVWYTAPTAIRMLMAADDKIIKKYDLSSLRYICSVGEPLNPEVIRWGLKVYELPIHDNWWQTETGSIMIANYPCLPIKPGSMGKPFPGIKAAVIDGKGNELPAGQHGLLALKPGWPSMLRKVWGDEMRFKEYFSINGWYATGDTAYKDEDGYFWFVGRADDVINTSGHRVGPFEVESALLEHRAVAESGVIGKPDAERGEIIKAFVVLHEDFAPSKALEEELKKFIRHRLAAHAYPREIEFCTNLPKTRSGKIMRRLLKARDLGLPTGDISTLED